MERQTREGPMSLKQAAIAGIERLRLPQWKDPLAHVRIDIIHGHLGPWVHVFDPFNKECNGRDPVDMLAVRPHCDPNDEAWLPYEGPSSDSDEYRAAAAQFEGVLT